MNTSLMTIDRIKLRLSQVPENKLSEIYNFVEYILHKPDNKLMDKPSKFEGIWKGKGFEKIKNIDDEIRNIRNTSNQLMSDRVIKESSVIEVIWR